MSAKVISQYCHVFVLEINFLPSILKDYLISKNYSATNIERKEIMIRRLKDIKITFLDKFLQNFTNSYSIIDTVRPKMIKKGNSNNFRISKTLINNKNGKFIDKNLFLLKMKKKHGAQKHSLILNKNNNDIDNKTFFEKKIKKNNFLIQTEEEMEKYKDKKNKSKTNLINLNSSIRCKTEKKIKNEENSLPKLKRFTSTNFRNKNRNKGVIDRGLLTESRINKLIPKISLLSEKLMFNGRDNHKRVNRCKNLENMTQLDFLFYDFYFTERSRKKYSKQSLILDE